MQAQPKPSPHCGMVVMSEFQQCGLGLPLHMRPACSVSAVHNHAKGLAGKTQCIEQAVLLRLSQADVYERLDALDSDTTEARAASILHGLGFDKDMQVYLGGGVGCLAG